MIKIRLTDAAGVTQIVADNITVIGPSSGGGGGGTVDATTIYQTGDLKPRYGTGIHTGWVRANGLTIGSSSSGATEPGGNIAAVQPLFIYLWGVDASLVVSGGRGASALADWTANKQLALPDWRGYNISALDDMGNTAAGRLGAGFANPTTLGSAAGLATTTLLVANLPPISSSGSSQSGAVTVQSANWVPSSATDSTVVSAGGSGGNASTSAGNTTVSKIQSSGTPAAGSASVTSTSTVSTPINIISPRKLCTIYIKL